MFDCFFFKQKTAYEMRISDWSSDVCSSDLFQGLSYEQVARALGARVSDIKNWIHYGKKKLKAHVIDHVRSYVSSAASFTEELEFVGRFIKLKIGRASCRERVCQYV